MARRRASAWPLGVRVVSRRPWRTRSMLSWVSPWRMKRMWRGVLWGGWEGWVEEVVMVLTWGFCGCGRWLCSPWTVLED